jgi:hypothetical protein
VIKIYPERQKKAEKKIEMTLAKEDSLLPCLQWPLTQFSGVTHTCTCQNPYLHGMGFCGYGLRVYKNPQVPQPTWGYASRDDP